MSVTRKFLDWNQPALPAAVNYLLSEYTVLGAADLSNVITVVPGRRAGRRLLELLIEAADRQYVRLTPPIIDTAGRLPEQLYESHKSFATPLVNKFAWTAALRRLDDSVIRSIIPDPPADNDISRWVAFGELLWNQHRELAAEGLDFQDVIERGSEVSAFDESERWAVLSEIQATCLKMLDDLELWDLQSARLFAIRHQECQIDKDIVLIGTADLNLATRQMLDQVSDRVTALIHAPQRMSRRFDGYGCISPDAWNGVPVEIASEQFVVVDGPADQATAVLDTLADYEGRYRIDEVTVGVADERLVPEIARRLQDEGVSSRWVVGQKLAESRPARLLGAVAEYLETERFESFAAIVRQTDLDAWLLRQPPESNDSDETQPFRPAWLRQLDTYFNRFLPSAPGDWMPPEDRTEQIRHIHGCLTALLQPFAAEPQPLGEWVTPLTELLLNVYGDVEFDIEVEHDSYTVSACRQIYELLLSHADIPDVLMPIVTASQAIRLLLNELGSNAVPPLPDDDALELLGWLELPLDDSPALVVTTVNEGFIPSSLNSDAFLPNTLRRHLGLLDNHRRYARDAYALSVLSAARRELRLIVARRDQRGDPLRPSRLLFATDPEEIARRVQLCFGSEELRQGQDLIETDELADESRFKIPRPEPLPEPVTRMGVTSFRTYLACPYRYYLRHVLRLREIDDRANELNALMFGNLMHDVLSQFGNGPLRNSTDPDVLRDHLRDLLEQTAQDSLSHSRMAAVNVQIMQLRWRLDAFAEWQARWAQDGWRIIFSELSFQDAGVTLKLDDHREVFLDGRIDRIDQRGNEYIIFDYKSSESVHPPGPSHLKKKDGWVDLQLPLYRHLGHHLGLHGKIDLGYIVLPKDTKKVQHLLADWTDEQLADADQTARQVVENVLDEQFWPPASVDGTFYEEFAPICQDKAFDREVLS